MEKNRRRRDPVFAKKDEEEMRLAFSGYEAKREKEREKKKRKIRSNRTEPRGPSAMETKAIRGTNT